MSTARNLVPVGQSIEKKYGIPIVNKRISVTPIATIGSSACKKPEDYVQIAKTLDKCAKELGINFIGGYTAIVSKGMTKAERMLIESIPQAMKETELYVQVLMLVLLRLVSIWMLSHYLDRL